MRFAETEARLHFWAIADDSPVPFGFFLLPQSIRDLPTYCTGLERLVLSGSFRVTDATVAAAVEALPNLKSFGYHHSQHVGRKLLEALGQCSSTFERRWKSIGGR